MYWLIWTCFFRWAMWTWVSCYYFSIIIPLGRAWPFIWTNLNPGILCAKFGWNWPSGSGEEDENVKSLQTDGRTDDRWSEKLTWTFSSGELKCFTGVIFDHLSWFSWIKTIISTEARWGQYKKWNSFYWVYSQWFLRLNAKNVAIKNVNCNDICL